jgi:hypothetical protein
MNQNPTLTFEFTLEQINAVLSVLPELPGKVCNPLIELIQAQAKPQIEALQTQAEPVPLETLAE